MKNLSISKKLILGFGIVLVLMIAIVVVSITSISSISGVTATYYKTVVPNTKSIGDMKTDIATVQLNVARSFLQSDVTAAQEEFDAAATRMAHLNETLTNMSENITQESTKKIFTTINEIMSSGGNIRQKVQDEVLKQTDASLANAKEIFTNEYFPFLEAINEQFDLLNDAITTLQEQQQDTAEKLQEQTWIILIAAGLIAIVATIIIILVIRRSILSPVTEIVRVYDEMSRGNIKDVKIRYEGKDELGKMAESIRKTNALILSYLHDISEKLKMMAQGDMRIDVDMDYIGDFAVIKKSLEATASSLNHTLQTINTAAEQVSTGASQVSSGAQALAAGSTEQASSVEELSVTVTKVAEQAAENSENVKVATQYVEQAGVGVATGNEHMGQLTQAMMEINTSSGQIANITKVIEDIAFQTNILALNAAIEAARAGNAGKGFAVVADEVRNLAAKSAEAAKQTSDLIQASVATVSKGTQITTQTAQILSDIQEKTKLVIVSIGKIDDASSEQAAAIEQIKQGLNQVSSVVQTNAATAEENSATSEEMSAQAATLHHEVSRFKLKNGYEKDSYAFIAPLREPVKECPDSLEVETSFGKY